jgi:hypothetical protein
VTAVPAGANHGQARTTRPNSVGTHRAATARKPVTSPASAAAERTGRAALPSTNRPRMSPNVTPATPSTRSRMLWRSGNANTTSAVAILTTPQKVVIPLETSR